MTASECAVALAIAKHANGWKNSHAKVETLAHDTKLDRRTVVRATASLVDKKWLIQTHSGRGGNARWANSYDLNIPAAPAAASKCHGVTLQSDMVSSQSDIEPVSKCHGVTTSSSYSTPRSSPVLSSEENRRTDKTKPEENRRRAEWLDTSYWVGISRKHPEGYFIQVKGNNTEPGGNHVRVDLTQHQARSLFDGNLYPYEHILGCMMQYAWDQNPGVEWLNVSV
jgi:hypothetical protein